jgi:hypothetical protein
MNSQPQERVVPREIPPEIKRSDHLRVKGELDEAMRVCVSYMNDNYDDVGALVMAAHILIDAKRLGLAQPLLKYASKLAPEESLIWNNLGLCYQEGADLEEGEACFKKALARDPTDAFVWNNLAQLYVNTGEPLKAIRCANKAIEIDPSMPDAHYNRGLAMLLLGNYKEGWDGFDYQLGQHKNRRERLYGSIPRWTGHKGLTLVAYGEQGIGDEISFASCIPDLQQENNVIIECDKRLEGLFRRSFACPVYGTRNEPGVSWPLQYPIEASVALGSLPGFYRTDIKDFPGTMYLVADPQRRLQWRALLDSLGKKKKVGIAWTGGSKNTGTARRSLSIYDLMPILRQDATFVSLQYKDCPEIEGLKQEGITIHHWPHAMQTQDYDDTAALVAELDLVITVTQAAVHLAGALGIACWVLTPKAPMWRYGLQGDSLPWYQSVKLYRQKAEWVHPISEIARDLREWVK